MKHFLLFVLIACLLQGCGGQAAPLAEPASESQITPTTASETASTPTETPAPTVSPTSTSEPTPTTAATPTDAVSSEAVKMAQSAYGAVLLTKAAAVLTEETAQQIHDGKVSGLKSFVVVVAVAAIISTTRGVFSEPAPLPDLQPIWDKGKTSVAALADVMSRWLDKKITSGDIPREMQTPNAVIEEMQQEARKLMVEKYKIDGAKLDQLYESTIQDMRAKLQKVLAE